MQLQILPIKSPSYLPCFCISTSFFGIRNFITNYTGGSYLVGLQQDFTPTKNLFTLISLLTSSPVDKLLLLSIFYGLHYRVSVPVLFYLFI